MTGVNRENRRNRMSRKERRTHIGQELLNKDKENERHSMNDWNLNWFTPQGRQMDAVESFRNNIYTIIDAPSGCGKTTTALWIALKELQSRNYDQLIFIKNPTEAGDDQIGYLSGSESDKLMAHMDTTKRIFHTFISKNKLENDISNDKIRLIIPNFLLGATFDNAIIIIDEVQTMSPSTVKLLTERCGKHTKYILLGDSGQKYSVKKRADGFADLISRATVENYGVLFPKYRDYMGYVKMTSEENMRSSGSAFINNLYKDL